MDYRWLLAKMGVLGLDLCACGPSAGGDEDATDGNATDTGESPECAARDPATALDVSIVAQAMPPTMCTVQELTGNGSAAIGIVLACEDGETGGAGARVGAEIEVAPPLALAVAVGDVVVAELVSDPSATPAKQSLWLREPGSDDVILALLDVTGPAWMDTLAPLEIVPIEGACPDQPTQNDCWLGHRVVLTVTHEGETTAVADGERVTVSSAAPRVVHLQQAFDGTLLECLDLPGEFYTALVARVQ